MLATMLLTKLATTNKSITRIWESSPSFSVDEAEEEVQGTKRLTGKEEVRRA